MIYKILINSRKYLQTCIHFLAPPWDRTRDFYIASWTLYHYSPPKKKFRRVGSAAAAEVLSFGEWQEKANVLDGRPVLWHVEKTRDERRNMSNC